MLPLWKLKSKESMAKALFTSLMIQVLFLRKKYIARSIGLVYTISGEEI
jgi:hypothetical protein